MPREVKDNVVLRQCEKTDGGYDLYMMPLPGFPQYVNANLEKVKLDKAEFGLPSFNIITSLENKYKSIDIKEDVCTITLFSGVVVKMPKERFKMLKALLLEQVSCCREYSNVVAKVAMGVIASTFNNSIVLKASAGEDLSPFEIEVFKAVYDFANKYY